MTAKKPQKSSTTRAQQSGKAHHAPTAPSAHPTVSGRWLLIALSISLPGAALCTWAVFCLLFWQGSWQLLYHPNSKVSRTPSSIGIAFDPVAFATTNAGITQLQGWWIPAESARYTALYLHGASGNVGDTLTTLASLHRAGLNVLAFDYRGYGQSQFDHPTEARWQQDATWALEYLTGTRHIAPHSIVIVGTGLGANLALETAVAHPDLAGVVLESPLDKPANIIFNDARAEIVPARLLVRDRYDLAAPAAAVRIPSLWLVENPRETTGAVDEAFQKVTAPKIRGELPHDRNLADPLEGWLSGLSK